MSVLSYSFHVSSKKNSLMTTNCVLRALKHNLRAYNTPDNENRDKNINSVLLGQKTAKGAYQDFVQAYKNIFDNYVKEYNQTKTKTRDKISDYLVKISNDKQKSIAAEVIIQIGDKEFWENYNLQEKQRIESLYKKQLERLQSVLPDFKIISAVIHYDETSPHLQIIGIPTKQYDKGLKLRVSKRHNFNREKLKMLQTVMRVGVEKEMKSIYGEHINIKQKEKGRNHDLSVKDYISMKYKNIEKIKKETEIELNQIKQEKNNFSNIENYEIKKGISALFDFNKLKNNYDLLLHQLKLLQKEVETLKIREFNLLNELELLKSKDIKLTEELKEKEKIINRQLITIKNQKENIENVEIYKKLYGTRTIELYQRNKSLAEKLAKTEEYNKKIDLDLEKNSMEMDF